jgi:hypothetical protein
MKGDVTDDDKVETMTSYSGSFLFTVVHIWVADLEVFSCLQENPPVPPGNHLLLPLP